ncbi:MAG: sialidase family protein, partial [Gemmatimonadota bacterium]
RQGDGFGTIGGSLVWEGEELVGVFGGGPFEDDEAGQHPFLVRTRDLGVTWSEPQPFGPPVAGDRGRQSVALSLFGPTQRGTYLAHGCHMQLGEQAERFYQDLSFRAYTLLIGRRPAGEAGFAYRRYPSGAFLGEQFMERGVQLPSGRLVFALWGCRARGENWRCGVLLSDDDGVTWQYRDVGYEPDRGIRDRPDGEGYPAGFNEQSLFLTPSGRLVSIIRGREKLGRLADSPRDTWFFRAVSDDGGWTWTKPAPANVAGTGAAGVGWVLPDGSLLHACRVPYSRTLCALPEPELFGLHLARSFDDGLTWQTEAFVQRDPEKRPFTNHYNAMNGQFVPVGAGRALYVFGQFDVAARVYRILALDLEIS